MAYLAPSMFKNKLKAEQDKSVIEKNILDLGLDNRPYYSRPIGLHAIAYLYFFSLGRLVWL